MALGFMFCLYRARVAGESMTPSIAHNSIVFAHPYFFWENIRAEDIVLALDPRDKRRIVKRVGKVTQDGYFIEGDNKNASTDSRHFGKVARKDIMGKVFFVLRI